MCAARRRGRCGSPGRSVATILHGPTVGVDTRARCPAHERFVLEARLLKRVAQSVQDVSLEALRECTSSLTELRRKKTP